VFRGFVRAISILPAATGLTQSLLSGKSGVCSPYYPDRLWLRSRIFAVSGLSCSLRHELLTGYPAQTSYITQTNFGFVLAFLRFPSSQAALWDLPNVVRQAWPRRAETLHLRLWDITGPGIMLFLRRAIFCAGPAVLGCLVSADQTRVSMSWEHPVPATFSFGGAVEEWEVETSPGSG
jgi:hypothetical protein